MFLNKVLAKLEFKNIWFLVCDWGEHVNIQGRSQELEMGGAKLLGEGS